MKKIIGWLVIACMVFSVQAQIASKVSWFFYPVSLPNSDNTYEFGTARDNFLTGIKTGGKSFTTTGTRVGTNVDNVTAIQIVNVFDASDIAASTTTNLWRGEFNPQSPFNAQFGGRAYVATLCRGDNGKVCLPRISYSVDCGSIPLLHNNSSLAGLDYSVSRIGIIAGPDGKLFTSDDTIVTSGSGTNLVDAIAFIGGRSGALINTPSDFAALNAAIGNGTWLRYSYTFTGETNVQNASITIPLFQYGAIDWNHYDQLVPFVGPEGVLFSVVGKPGSPKMSIYGARNIQLVNSYLVKTDAVEGYTVFWNFTGNPTNDAGWYVLKGTNVGPVTLSNNVYSAKSSNNSLNKSVVVNNSSELNQD